MSEATHSNIHPTAIIEAGAQLGPGCTVGPYAIVHACCTLAAEVHVGAHCVLGGLPQSIAFNPSTPSTVHIGASTCVREGVTINRATVAGGATTIGPGCYLMAQSHVAHDCVLEAGVILANQALVGGWVHIGAHAFIGGGAALHQKIKIGTRAMVGGNAPISKNVPPFVTVAQRNQLAGLNMVGLKRAGFSAKTVADLKACYRAVYLAKPKRALQPTTPQGETFAAFFKTH